MISRITNPDTVNEDRLLSTVGAWGLPTIQFSKPGQSKALLRSINALCKVFGKKLPIRFYAHYQNDFDASVLKYLPDVQWLLVDCLQEISNPEQIFELSKLKKLSFGVYNHHTQNFLNQLDIDKLEQLTIGETKKRNFDLSSLRDGKQIRSLSVVGHEKNINVIGEMDNLESLSLHSIGKKVSLDFVSRIAKLKTLKITLGGRENINEIKHPLLRELEIIRIRGFNDLGNLSRFPHLRRLNIEDQIKILSISLQNPELNELKILNCKALNELNGLEALKKINHLRCYRTSLDYENLSQLNWSKSLKFLALYSGNNKRDKALRSQLDSRGFKEF
ncbi:MAG: hypothetical protein ABJG88_02070 [Litorimonas sp.]